MTTRPLGVPSGPASPPSTLVGASSDTDTAAPHPSWPGVLDRLLAWMRAQQPHEQPCYLCGTGDAEWQICDAHQKRLDAIAEGK